MHCAIKFEICQAIKLQEQSTTFITNMNKNKRYFNFTKFSKLCPALQFLRFRDFGILVHKDPTVKYTKPKSPFSQLATSRVWEFVSRKLSTHSSKRRYPRCDKGMALFFVSALSTYNRRLGLNVSASRNSHLRECVSRTLMPPFAIFRDVIGQR